MTLFSPHNRPPVFRPNPSRRRGGFTLIELLVVMGIILVLVSLLLPAITRARRNAVRQSMLADLSVISQALDAYRDDFGDYPRTGLGAPPGQTTPSVSVSGAAVLCWALVAPGNVQQDGAGLMNGSMPASPDPGAPGFRVIPTQQGRVYGPYISLDHFKIGVILPPPSGSPPNDFVSTPPAISPKNPWDDTNTVLADRYGNVILYYPANKGAVPSAAYIGNYKPGTTPLPSPLPMYNYGDNAAYTLPGPGGSPILGVSELTLNAFSYRLGNAGATGPLTAGKVPIIAPYLLWSAGADGQFGPQLNSNNKSSGEDDDVIYPADQLLSFPPNQAP